MTSSLLTAACLLGLCATEPRYDFKPHFADPLRYPIQGSAIAKGHVRLETEQGAAKSPALRLDCTGCKDRVVVVNFNLPADQIDRFREKRLVFRARVQWLSGQGTLAVMMRTFGKQGLVLGSQASRFEGEKGKWQPWRLRCMIPANKEIERVDFHLGVTSTPEPAVLLLDEVAVELDRSSPAAAPRTFVGASSAADRQPLQVVADGKPLATIITAGKPTPTVRYAVEELNEHLALCTGVRLPVATDERRIEGPTIHVGRTALTARLGVSPDLLPADNWLVWRVGSALILSGGDNPDNLNPVGNELAAFGTLYAVYEFLERAVDVRWYWPGDLGRVAPQRRELSLAEVRWQGCPTYQTRFFWYAVPSDKSFSAKDVWRWWRRQRWGGVGGSPIGMHSFNEWPKRFGATHPEYFALQRDGHRANADPHGYVCLSNPAVAAQVIADKRQLLDKYPWVRCQPVMPADSFDLGYCQCPECRAAIRPERGEHGLHSDLVWGFVNRVAAEVRRSHPDRFITCCAYSEYAEVPRLHLEPNVAVTLCAGRFFPNLMWKPAAKAEYVAWIDAWSRKAANLYVWDYWLPRHQKGIHGAPTIYPHAIQEWLLLDRGRVKGHAIELENIDAEGRSSSLWENPMFDWLNVYVAMRLMWKLDQDVDRILDQHFDGFYGPAAPLVKRFYTAMEEAYANPATKGPPECRWDWSTCWVETYPPALVAAVMGNLREAERITRGREPYHARAAMLLQGFLPMESQSRRWCAGR